MRRNRWNVEDSPEYRGIRVGLREAFKALRKKGYLANINYLCCTSCGMSAMSERINKMAQKPPGVMFTHAQDMDNLKDGHDLFIAYSSSNDTEDATEEGEIKVGEDLFAALQEAGLNPIWEPRTPQTRIMVPGVRRIRERKEEECRPAM